VSRVALSRDNVTAQQAQQGNVTPLFPDNDNGNANHNDEDTEII